MMVQHLQSKSMASCLENPLDRALIGFMNQHKGKWIKRDRIMHCCGFDCPKEHPVGAYAQFHNSLIRTNQALKPHDLRINQSEDGAQIYSMGSAEQ